MERNLPRSLRNSAAWVEKIDLQQASCGSSDGLCPCSSLCLVILFEIKQTLTASSSDKLPKSNSVRLSFQVVLLDSSPISRVLFLEGGGEGDVIGALPRSALGPLVIWMAGGGELGRLEASLLAKEVPSGLTRTIGGYWFKFRLT